MENNKKVYLKPNIVPEPLFDSWYAWPHLISPPTSAMNILERHLKIMDSYIQAPHIHSSAVKNPKMLGGPFMDYDTNRVEDIKKLKKETLEKQKDLLELAEAIKELSRLLMSEGDGYSLEPLYEKVPPLLKGYVELVYDINNQPSYRFYEQLLYNSKYYNKSNQSIAFYEIENDDRAFVLSTPRLDNSKSLHLKIPFGHKGIDELFKMQRVPNSFEYIKDLLDVPLQEEELFRTFFTDKIPQPYHKYEGNDVRIRYFGHACILVESKEISILSDPVISYGYNSELSRYSYQDLPDIIDYVVITHSHQDHILIESMLQLRHKVKNIIVPRNGNGSLSDLSLKLILNNIGFNNVIVMDEFDVLELSGIKIQGLPFIGEHSDLNIMTKLCYLVELNHHKILFAADSCNIEPQLYNYIQKLVGNVDILFLGMECEGAPLSWFYGPLLTETISRDKDYSRTLSGSNYQRAINMVESFNPKQVYVYAMGQEPWLRYIMAIKYTEESNPIIESNRLINECISRGIVSERLYGEKELKL